MAIGGGGILLKIMSHYCYLDNQINQLFRSLQEGGVRGDPDFSGPFEHPRTVSGEKRPDQPEFKELLERSEAESRLLDSSDLKLIQPSNITPKKVNLEHENIRYRQKVNEDDIPGFDKKLEYVTKIQESPLKSGILESDFSPGSEPEKIDFYKKK